MSDPLDPDASAAGFTGAAVHTYDGTRKSKRVMWRLLDIQEGDSILVMPGGKAFIAKAHVLAAIKTPDSEPVAREAASGSGSGSRL